MQREQEKAALAIEKANRRRPAVGGIRSTASTNYTSMTGAAGSAKKTNHLKFNGKPEGGNHSQSTNDQGNNGSSNQCSSCKASSQNNTKTMQMLIKQDPANRSLLNDNQVLTNELVNVNRELTKMKAELRSQTETCKKSEKENLEMKKNVSAKQTSLDKLRKERDELWAIVNTDKYKSIQSIETD